MTPLRSQQRLTTATFIAALLGACGGSVTVENETSNEGGSSGAGGNGSVAQTGGAHQGGGQGSEGGDQGWTVPPLQMFAKATCNAGQMSLIIKVWPDPKSACDTTAGTYPDVLRFGVLGWDGSSGSYTVDEPSPSGKAFAEINLNSVDGTITVEPFDIEPNWIQWDLEVGSGRTSLAECGDFEDLGCTP